MNRRPFTLTEPSRYTGPNYRTKRSVWGWVLIAALLVITAAGLGGLLRIIHDTPFIH